MALRDWFGLLEARSRHDMGGLVRRTMALARGLTHRHQFDRAGPVQLNGPIKVIKRNGRIHVGRCIFWPHVKIECLGASPSRLALLEIGDFSTIGDRTEFHVAGRIIIGRNVRISWDCVIMDRNYHGVGEENEVVRPVRIDDEAWLGCRVIVLPGVHIGQGAVIGAGAVVTKDVPAGCVAVGNPARVIGMTEPANREPANREPGTENRE